MQSSLDLTGYHSAIGNMEVLSWLEVWPAPLLPAEVSFPLPAAMEDRHNFRLPGLKAIIPREDLAASDF